MRKHAEPDVRGGAKGGPVARSLTTAHHEPETGRPRGLGTRTRWKCSRGRGVAATGNCAVCKKRALIWGLVDWHRYCLVWWESYAG